MLDSRETEILIIAGDEFVKVTPKNSDFSMHAEGPTVPDHIWDDMVRGVLELYLPHKWRCSLTIDRTDAVARIVEKPCLIRLQVLDRSYIYRYLFAGFIKEDVCSDSEKIHFEISINGEPLKEIVHLAIEQ